MRARSLFLGFLFIACCVSAASEESPHDLAVRLISSDPAPIYQARDSTGDEQKAATRLNAESQLQRFILSDAVSEEIRVCYAMHVLVDRLILARDLSDSQLAKAYREDLNRSYDTLANYLHELKEQKRAPTK